MEVIGLGSIIYNCYVYLIWEDRHWQIQIVLRYVSIFWQYIRIRLESLNSVDFAIQGYW